MVKDDLKSKTVEQLMNQLKATKIIAGALIGVLSLLFSVTIYGLIAKDDNAVFIALMVVAFSCSATLPLQFGTMKKIKDELKLREAK
ncbi:MAG: hypothetical protein AB8B73_11710 [Ekhidna sp.]